MRRRITDICQQHAGRAERASEGSRRTAAAHTLVSRLVGISRIGIALSKVDPILVHIFGLPNSFMAPACMMTSADSVASSQNYTTMFFSCVALQLNSAAYSVAPQTAQRHNRD